MPSADDPRLRGPVPARLGRLFEPAYRFAITRRNRAFDRGRGVTRLDVPVISVGNLSVGGTGKTPMVAHMVATLLRGDPGLHREPIRPCIAMRGYTPSRARARRGRLNEPDETDAYRRMFPGVPIVAQPDRLRGLRRLFSASEPGSRPTCVVLDDGFQHRKIARDLDIVLIDASRPPLDDRLLPAGWLREPVESLTRAGFIVFTHAELVDPVQVTQVDAGLRSRVGKGADAVARHVWTGLRTGDGESETLLPLDWLLGKRVAAACAIGNPRGFIHSLRATVGEGLEHGDGRSAGHVVGTMVLPDHDPYGPEVVSALSRLAAEGDADAIVITDKDWSKLRRLPPDRFDHRPVVRPVLAMVFDRGQPELDSRVLATVRGAGGPSASG